MTPPKEDEKDDEMIREFSIEATDMLDQAETDLLSLDKGGDFKTLFDSVFRVFHSLKGGAGMLGLEPLQKHMHTLEDKLSALKANERLTSDEANFFLEGVDAGRQLLNGKIVNFIYEVKDLANPKKGSAQSKVKTTESKPAKYFEPKKSHNAVAYIIDDEPDIAENLCHILNDGNIDTLSFTNPIEALSALKSSPPDVILTDMKMPEMSGLELIRQVHEISPDIPVILISGYITTEALLDAIRSGVFAAIEKPFKVDVILTYTLAAIKQHNTFKMFRRSLNLLLYQFSDLEEFLVSNGKDTIAHTARAEITTLMAQWKKLQSHKDL